METAIAPAPVAEPPAAGPAPDAGMGAALRPILVEAALPVGAYFVARDAAGASLVAAIAVSSAITVAVGGWTLAREQVVHALPLLVLASNVAALVFGLTTGSARFLIAKDSAVSSVVALAILASVLRGRPLMSEGLLPFLTRGRPERIAAVARLRRGPAFRRLEVRYSLVWGVALLLDCVLRIVGAYTVAPATMAWASTVLLVGAIVVATVVGGAVGAGPLAALVDAEAEHHRGG